MIISLTFFRLLLLVCTPGIQPSPETIYDDDDLDKTSTSASCKADTCSCICKMSKRMHRHSIPLSLHFSTCQESDCGLPDCPVETPIQVNGQWSESYLLKYWQYLLVFLFLLLFYVLLLQCIRECLVIS